MSLYSKIFVFSCMAIFMELEFQAQKIVTNGSFEEVDSCVIQGNGVTFNRPKGWWHGMSTGWEFIVSSNTAKELCIEQTSFQPFDGQHYLRIGFKVTTSRVSTGFIQTELNHPLQKDSVYTISMRICKNQFSIGFIDELQLLFSACKLNSTEQYVNPFLHSSILSIKVDSVSSKDWYLASINYSALGYERYLSLGSFDQVFSLKNGLRNYQAEQILNQTNVANAIYFIDDLKIEVQPFSEVGSKRKEIERKNLQNRLYSTNNLILNSGFEYSTFERDKEYNNFPSGIELIPGWMSFGVNSALIYVVDSNSNFYRYNNLNGNYPYMGRGIAEVSILKTNKHHQYQQVWNKHVGTEYTSIYKYENEPTQQHIKKFEYGVYFTGILKEYLVRDSSYLFSMMSKLSSESSYGVKYIGVFFNQDFSRGFNDSLLHGQPDILFDVSTMAKNSNWQEFTSFYKAKGNESYFTIGYYYSDDNLILKNYGFQRVISSTCGPNYSNGSYCWNYEAIYKDSLFANYYFDNFLLRPVDGKEVLGSAIYDASIINQTQWIFDFGGTKENIENIEKVKQLLIESLNIMRIDDGIAITYVHKANELKLSPTTYENKRKIIRYVNQYKTTIKSGYTHFQEYTLLFDGKQSKGFNNHVILITEGALNFEKGMQSITNYCSNGGKFTIIHTGNSESKKRLENIFGHIPQIRIIEIGDSNNLEQLIGLMR